MGRPPTPIGSCGIIRTREVAPKSYRSWTYYRDADGKSRLISRTGPSAAAAERHLKVAVSERSGPAEGQVTGDRFAAVAAVWRAGIEQAVRDGERSITTGDLYARQLRNHVLPALGDLRIREVTVSRVDTLLREVRQRSGAPTARTCRSVVSGVLGLAVRHDVVPTNAAREVSRIPATPAREPRALTDEERAALMARLAADPRAVARDLPDLTAWLLGTGLRIGEALAVSWAEIDLDTATAVIEYKIIRATGQGLLRVRRMKSDAGERTLRLPRFVVSMLRRRKLAAGGAGPVFADAAGGWRDPSNTRRDLRRARGEEFDWVVPHTFRKTVATQLDDANLPARRIADQLGHSRPSLTQDVYLSRRAPDQLAAAALDAAAGS